jgi:hypothetical protein
MQRPRRHRHTARLVFLLALLYGVIVLLIPFNPWAIHIGHRWTPLLTWTGTGKLVTTGGTYPVVVTHSVQRSQRNMLMQSFMSAT